MEDALMLVVIAVMIACMVCPITTSIGPTTWVDWFNFSVAWGTKYATLRKEYRQAQGHSKLIIAGMVTVYIITNIVVMQEVSKLVVGLREDDAKYIILKAVSTYGFPLMC